MVPIGFVRKWYCPTYSWSSLPQCITIHESLEDAEEFSSFSPDYIAGEMDYCPLQSSHEWVLNYTTKSTEVHSFNHIYEWYFTPHGMVIRKNIPSVFKLRVLQWLIDIWSGPPTLSMLNMIKKD